MPSAGLVTLATVVSRLFGWIYTLSWSLSFYPQPLLNLRRRSTIGTTFSFPTVNVLGFLAYFLSTTVMYASPLIRAQYAARNPASPLPTVRGNDIVYAAHALGMSLFTWSMFWKRVWGFDQGGNGKSWRIGRGILGVMVGCVVAVAWVVGLVLIKGRDGGRDPEGWAWIDVIYAIGFVKLAITMVKYMPQVITNYRRKSTVGWSIEQIFMDALGGVLSVLQLVIDSSLQGDWSSGLRGNPVKLGLGNVSVFFDIIFIIQHFILYRNAKAPKEKQDEEHGSLAGDSEATALLR